MIESMAPLRRPVGRWRSIQQQQQQYIPGNLQIASFKENLAALALVLPNVQLSTIVPSASRAAPYITRRPSPPHPLHPTGVGVVVIWNALAATCRYVLG